MNAQPLVSVITATYNMGKYLPETIDAILAQDYPALDLVVVDDGSTDDTPEVLARYAGDDRVTVITQENQGQTVAKNRGITAARGEIVGFCDADDVWLPGKLSRQVPCFAANDRIGVVYGNMIYVDGEGEPLPIAGLQGHSGRITEQLLIDNFVAFPTVMVRKSILEEMGGFDESLTMSIDYDLWLRISVKYHFLHLDEPLANYRIWEGQMSHKTGERLDNFFRLLDRFLAENPRAASPAAVRRGYAHAHVTRGHWHGTEGRKGQALRDFGRAFAQRPHDARMWRNLIKVLTGI